MPLVIESIKKLRKREDLSQRGLARIFNVSGNAISMWESGKSVPTINHLDQLYNLAYKTGHFELVFYRPR